MVRRAYADIPSGQAHYQTQGDGEPLLLLHQSPLSSDEYLGMIPLLAKSHRVIAVDSPGYGKSDPLLWPCGIAEYADWVVRFLDCLSIEKATIVGDHTGAAIAVEVAVVHPELVTSLILSGCPHYEPEVRRARLKDPKYSPMKIEGDGSHLQKVWKIPGSFAPDAAPEYWHRVVVDYLVAGEHATDGWHALFRYDIELRLPLIKCPTLLISGNEDVFFHRLDATSRLIPRCRTKVIEGGGDVIAYDRAEDFAGAILAFLRNPEV